MNHKAMTPSSIFQTTNPTMKTTTPTLLTRVLRRASLVLLALVSCALDLPVAAQSYAPSATVFAFNGTNGSSPAGIMRAADGNYYGTTYRTVFKLTAAGVFTNLANLDNSAHGSQIEAGVVFAGDGNLYGNALGGGANGMGTVFRVTPAGEITKLVDFDGTNGAYPSGPMVLAADGAMYGITQQGGTEDRG